MGRWRARPGVIPGFGFLRLTSAPPDVFSSPTAVYTVEGAASAVRLFFIEENQFYIRQMLKLNFIIFGTFGRIGDQQHPVYLEVLEASPLGLFQNALTSSLIRKGRVPTGSEGSGMA